MRVCESLVVVVFYCREAFLISCPRRRQNVTESSRNLQEVIDEESHTELIPAAVLVEPSPSVPPSITGGHDESPDSPAAGRILPAKDKPEFVGVPSGVAAVVK